MASPCEGRGVRLQRRLSRSAQREAGALDTAAGLLEGLGTGCVGNAEVRREAEGRAMHHRDPLGRKQVFDEILVGLDDLARWRFLPQLGR